jgi:hypothetical protein
MIEVIVHLATATICFVGHCYPALVGHATPFGNYQIVWRKVVSPGYGGDILAFAEDSGGIYAIHRVWTSSPRQHRVERLTHGSPAERRWITEGCINVMPEVYDKLINCCTNARLIIEK